ncbi:MAG: FAD binding domain-containing protein [Planctomycetota bacterium]|jgi:carbon-monoxide dehydrogenase medium subunit
MTYDYHRPKSVDEALALALEFRDSRFIAGGTDLMVQMRAGKCARPSAMISLRGIDSLSEIGTDNGLRIGANVSLQELLNHNALEGYLALRESIAVLGSRQIRNVATLAGNLCNASPGADTAAPLLVFDARIEMKSDEGKREIAISDFFTGPGKTVLQAGEIVTAILVPPVAGPSVFLRKGRVSMDIATAGVAALGGANPKLSAIAVGPTPMRLERAESILAGQILTTELIEQAATAAAEEVKPIDDVRASANYRRQLVRVFVRRVLTTLAEETRGAE